MYVCYDLLEWYDCMLYGITVRGGGGNRMGRLLLVEVIWDNWRAKMLSYSVTEIYEYDL
jgi:hypothetical protein